MCLVALAWKTHPRWRLVLAGNRDEHYARPTAALARWPDAAVLAGRDLRSGGTWMGLAPGGRVAVVTNVRHGLPSPFPGPSRGALPVDFLTARTDAAAHAEALAARAATYAPFNLLLADAGHCAYVGNHPASGAQAITAGVHGLSNGAFDADWPKTRALRATLRHWVEAGDDSLQPLWDALADTRIAADAELPDTGIGLALERPLSAAFVRQPGYGTRASTLILVGHDDSARIHERSFDAAGRCTGETRLALPPT